jgi:hypothetical protein
MKMALLEVIERKRVTEFIGYRGISARHGVSADSLRQTFYFWKKGWIDLGEPQSDMEKQIDARMQHESTLELLRRYKNIVLKGFEKLLLKSEDAVTHGKPLAWQKYGLPQVVKELKKISEIQSIHEKGYASILDDVAAQMKREKLLPGKTMDVATETKILHANDEEKALAALNGELPASNVPEQAPTPLSE